jgi:hypothetical protein
LKVRTIILANLYRLVAFSFGVQGWNWGEPRPQSITFFLDNTAMVCDQHGRPVRTVVTDDGTVLRFADSPPSANKEGDVTPRPQFATHQQVIAALTAERIDWLSYTVRYRGKDNAMKSRAGLTKEKAEEFANKLAKEGHAQVVVGRTIECAGWPQLTYDELKKLPELPPTPLEEVLKIRDKDLRDAAFRVLGLQVDRDVVASPRVLPPGVIPIPGQAVR